MTLEMTIEEIESCTLEDVKDLVDFAHENDIEVPDVYDLDTDKDIFWNRIAELLDDSGIKMVYEYVKDAATGNSPFVMEDDCGYLVPFTETDFEALRDYILERIS